MSPPNLARISLVGRTALPLALAGLLLAGCGGGGGGSGATHYDTPRTEVPADLVGDWLYGTISPTNFWDDHTGQYEGSAYGISDYYRFDGDGTFEEYTYLYTQSYGCRTQAWTRMEGTVAFDGATFTKYAGAGRYRAADNCIAAYNFERDMKPEEVAQHQGQVYDWGLEADPASGDVVLWIAPAGSGEAAAYEAR